MNPTAIMRPYKDFYSLFRLVTQGKGVMLDGLQFLKDKSYSGKGHRFVLAQPIHLSGWPVEPNSRKSPKVDISVYARITFSDSDPRHTGSNVYVTYFDTGRGVATPIENLRFDYHPETGGVGHPLFHGHVFSSKPVDKIPASWGKYDVQWGNLEGRYDSVRMPIPHMSLPSVLCFLVGNHLGEECMANLLRQSGNVLSSFPSAALLGDPNCLLTGDMDCDHRIHGFHWFGCGLSSGPS